MAIPVPLVHCEYCERRFVLQPDAVVEDEVFDTFWLLCQTCRTQCEEVSSDCSES